MLKTRKIASINFVSQLSLRKRLIDGLLWSLVNAVSTQGLTFLLSIIIANLLGKNLFGKFGIINSTFLTFVGVAQLATGYAANKYVAEFRHSDKAKASRLIVLFSFISIITGCLAGIVLLLGAPVISSFLREPSLAPYFMIISFAVFFGVFNGYQMGVLSGLESYFQIARVSIIMGLLNLFGCAIGVWLFGLKGIIVALVVNAFVQCFVFNRVVKRETILQGIIPLGDGFRQIQQEGSIFFKFLFPAAFSGFFSMPALWVVNVILVRSADGFNQMALFSAVNTIRVFVVYVPTIFNKVIMSVLNNQKGLDNQQGYKKVFWFNIAITVGSVLFGAVIVGSLGQLILTMFGKDFKAGYPVLLVMLLATIFEGISQSFYQVFQVQEKMWLSFWAIVVPRDCLMVVLAIFLIPYFGALGSAWAYTLALLLALSVTIFFSLRINRLASCKILTT